MAINQNRSSIYRKTVIITGASSGVGRAAAEEFAKQGANVVIVARGKKGVDDVVEICSQHHVAALGITADVSVEQDVKRVVETALEINGQIDVWINNAGVMASGKFEEIPIDIHEQVIKTNLVGYMYGAYYATKVFKSQNFGILVNNISIGGYMPAPYSAVYSATKYGIRGLMECLQGEISNLSDVHVCNLYPQLQNSTGNLHSAKFSGFNFSIPPLASDPRDTAKKMVSLVRHPRKKLFPDFRSAAITTSYRLFPNIVMNIASAGARMMMENSTTRKDDPGNVLTQSREPMRIHGKQPKSSLSKNLPIAILAGAGLGIAVSLLFRKRD